MENSDDINTTGFKVGEEVTVLKEYPLHHCRTPYYCRGKIGTIERICGEFRNPEELAYGKEGLPKITLYRVRFAQIEVWPDYQGDDKDILEIEIYENWLKRK